MDNLPPNPTTTTPVNQPVVPTPPLPTKNSSKTIVIIIISVVLIGLMAATAFFIVSKQSANKNTGITQLLPSPLPTNAVIPPIDIDKAYIQDVTFSYSFIGKVSMIQQEGTNLVIMTDIMDDELPKFVTGETTKVNFRSNGQLTPAKPTDIKQGQDVEIRVPYVLRENKWDTIVFINILQAEAATPSASPI